MSEGSAIDLKVEMLHLPEVRRLIMLVREIADETTEPHIRKKIIEELRAITGHTEAPIQ